MEEIEENPNYYAIIPADVRYADIPANAKLLYGEITALCNKTGVCFASNDYFAKLYGVNKISISRLIKTLIDENFITAEYTYKKGSKEIENRCIKLASGGINKNVNRYIQNCIGGINKNVTPPLNKNVKDNITRVVNNTRINNKRNTTYKESEKLSRYGEFGNVCLEKAKYEELEATYGIDKLNYAIEKLDAWLDKTPKEQNKNHRGYFKSNGWVWEKYTPAVNKYNDAETISIKDILGDE